MAGLGRLDPVLSRSLAPGRRSLLRPARPRQGQLKLNGAGGDVTDQSVSDRGSPMDDDKRLCHDRAISLHFSIGISRRLRQFSTRLGMRVLSDSRFQISNPFFRF